MNEPISPIAMAMVGVSILEATWRTFIASASEWALVAILTMSASISSHCWAICEQVGRGLLEVVVADDPPGLAEPADVAGDVHLDVDEVDPGDDRLAHQPLALLLGGPPEAAVDPSADGEDHRRGPFLQDPLEVGLAAEAVDPELDQLDAGLGRGLPFLGERGVSAAPEYRTDHQTTPTVVNRPDGPRSTLSF